MFRRAGGTPGRDGPPRRHFGALSRQASHHGNLSLQKTIPKKYHLSSRVNTFLTVLILGFAKIQHNQCCIRHAPSRLN
jgi:hypothetical protein